MKYSDAFAACALFGVGCLFTSCESQQRSSQNENAKVTMAGVENEPLEKACQRLGLAQLLKPSDKALKVVRIPGGGEVEVSVFPEGGTVGMFVHDGYYFTKNYSDPVLSVKNADGEENFATSHGSFSDFKPGGLKKGELRLIMGNSAMEELLVLIYDRKR